MEKMKQLQGKNILLTGANRGIGRSILEKLAEHGANVWACSRSYHEEFETDIRNLEKKYCVRIVPVYFDLTKEEEMKAAIKQIVQKKHTIDALINNAGMAFGGSLYMTGMKQLKEVFEVNYFAAIQLTQYVSKYMIRQKHGIVVNMASVGGIESKPGYLAYGSSKAALIWATKCLANELAPYHIRVNAIAPGLVNTEMGFYKSEKELSETIQRTPQRRMAEPEEIAEAVLYLVSEQSAFITGHTLVIDGGRTIA